MALDIGIWLCEISHVVLDVAVKKNLCCRYLHLFGGVGALVVIKLAYVARIIVRPYQPAD